MKNLIYKKGDTIEFDDFRGRMQGIVDKLKQWGNNLWYVVFVDGKNKRLVRVSPTIKLITKCNLGGFEDFYDEHM